MFIFLSRSDIPARQQLIGLLRVDSGRNATVADVASTPSEMTLPQPEANNPAKAVPQNSRESEWYRPGLHTDGLDKANPKLQHQDEGS